MINSNYDKRGVSADKNEVHQAIRNLPSDLYPYAFCKIYPDFLAQDEQYCCISHADGAGTKSSLAYIYWRETNDTQVWKGIAQDALFMNLDDMLCAGATDNFVYTSTIGRNKNKISGDVIKNIVDGTLECIDMLKEYGINIHFMGGETADVGDLVRTIIVDGNMTCRMKRTDVIDNASIADGDVIVGLASYGKSTYEKAWNAGMGSNGLTSARHDFFCSVYAEKYPESYDQALEKSVIYQGSFLLQDSLAGLPVNAGMAILSPTRTYAPIIKKIFELHRNNIHGMIHCTGGAQTKCLKFVQHNLHIIKNNLFETPIIFTEIQKASQTSWSEMYKVFNMGHRMEIYTNRDTAQAIIDISRSFDIDAQIIGHVQQSTTRKLTIESAHGKFEYN